MSRGNCLMFAVRLWMRRMRRWVRAGRPKYREPSIKVRPSRLAPWWIPHFEYVERCPSGRWRVIGYRPNSNAPLPWYLVHLAARFDGHAHWGDL